MPRQTGFTLIEIMIAVAIIGILSAIAIPAYNDHVRRAKLTEVGALLADYRVKLEQYYQDNRNYGAAGGACGVALPTSTYFTLACAAGNQAQTYTATATSRANSGLGAAGAYVYTINDANARATTTFEGTAVAKSCWVIRGGEC